MQIRTTIAAMDSRPSASPLTPPGPPAPRRPLCRLQKTREVRGEMQAELPGRGQAAERDHGINRPYRRDKQAIDADMLIRAPGVDELQADPVNERGEYQRPQQRMDRLQQRLNAGRAFFKQIGEQFGAGQGVRAHGLPQLQEDHGHNRQRNQLGNAGHGLPEQVAGEDIGTDQDGHQQDQGGPDPVQRRHHQPRRRRLLPGVHHSRRTRRAGLPAPVPE